MRTTSPAAEQVRSPDGTSIALWRSGHGSSLVALHGATIDHSTWDGVRPALEQVATLIAVDRRGHGASDQGPPTHSLDQEVADLAAVVEACPPPVDVLAHSYGGLVALEAARLGLPVARLIVYEPSIDDDPRFPGVVDRVAALVDQGETERAAEALLIERSGVPADAIAAIRDLPLWPVVLRGVQVFPREGAAVIGYRFDPARFARLTIPTLVLLGAESPTWRQEAMRALHSALPRSELRILAAQGHLATHTAPELLAGEITRFLER
jgi:pimeloyl-ACP methyl ester carboxylesterase